MIQENYQRIRKEIDDICLGCNRSPEDVLLIAVSKTKPVSDMEELLNIGVRDFGENYPQELTEKYGVLPKSVHLHQIGHLQTNKVKYIIDKACMIHAVDSLHLAKTIEKECEKHDLDMDILIEVNFAEEESKFGVKKEETEELVRSIAESCPRVHIQGLMTIAPFVENPEHNRPIFKGMRELALDIKSKNIDNVSMNALSMGMTNDYKIAIEEGATMVRVGTAIFGARNYNK